MSPFSTPRSRRGHPRLVLPLQPRLAGHLLHRTSYCSVPEVHAYRCAIVLAFEIILLGDLPYKIAQQDRLIGCRVHQKNPIHSVSHSFLIKRLFKKKLYDGDLDGNGGMDVY
eukprot:scaffold15119_cov63-Cyclotella_meneghiniana.AAC.13